MPDDERILALFFARSEEAIIEMDKTYGKLCYRMAYNIVNNGQDAEECVNDAYLGAWNAIPPAKPCPLLPYLAKIVRNCALNLFWRMRAAKRSGGYTVPLQEIEGCIADHKTVDSEMDVRELARAIERFLDTLSREDRAIFMLRYWFAESYRSIAARVGLSEKVVSVRLARIRQKMRRYLMEKEVLP